MSEIARPRAPGSSRARDRQIWITRSHLAAIGVSSLLIATLAFLVGMQVGRRQSEVVPSVASAGPSPFLPDPADEEALEALLREVEFAQASIAPTGEMVTPERADRLVFPEVLSGEVSVQTVTPQEAPAGPVNLVGPRPEIAPTYAPNAGAAVTTGWSVQVATTPDAATADARVAALTEQKLKAYRVGALVDGQTWYRVRVGGFTSRKEAETARERLAIQLGAPDLVVAEAP